VYSPLLIVIIVLSSCYTLCVCTGARCVRKKILYNTTRRGTHLLAFV